MHVSEAFPWVEEADLPSGPLAGGTGSSKVLACWRGEAGGRMGQHTPLHAIHTVKPQSMQHCATPRSQLLQKRHGLGCTPNLGQRAGQVVAIEGEDRELGEGAGGAPLHALEGAK